MYNPNRQVYIMTKLDFYWRNDKNWYHWEGNVAVLNDDAPEEAKKSYQNYLRQKEEKKDII